MKLSKIEKNKKFFKSKETLKISSFVSEIELKKNNLYKTENIVVIIIVARNKNEKNLFLITQ